MTSRLQGLGTTRRRWACVGATDVIDVSPLLTETPVNLSVQTGPLKYWVGSVLRPGIQFILDNPREEEDVDYRDDWALWAPIVIDGQIYDTIFTARHQDDAWRFGLFIYGGTPELHDLLRDWALIGFPKQLRGGSVIGYPERTEEKGMLVTSFEVISPGSVHEGPSINLNSRPPGL